MRKCSSMLVALAFLLSAAPAFSQSPSPDAIAAARELLATMRMADQYKALLPTVLQAMKPAIVQNRPQVERDFDAIAPLLVEGMAARLSELIDAAAVVYARNFTADELRDVAAFYRTPTGEKFLQKLPAVTQQSMVMGQKWGQAVAGELQNRMANELRKRGHDI
jgi:uncharacterized protein